jgi:hypothetical protein
MGVASIVTANPAGNAAKPNTNMYVLSLSPFAAHECMQAALTDFAPGYGSAPAPPTTGRLRGANCTFGPQICTSSALVRCDDDHSTPGYSLS